MEVANHRVFILPGRLQLGDDATDTFVHYGEHRGVNFHATDLEFFVLHLVPLAGLWGESPRRVRHPELLLFFPARRAHRGVAAIVAAFVFRDVPLARVHGPVCGGVGHVEQKRLSGLITFVFTNKLRGVIAQCVGVVIIL